MPKGAVFSVPYAELALFIPDLNAGVIQNGRRFLENKKIKTRKKKNSAKQGQITETQK